LKREAGMPSGSAGGSSGWVAWVCRILGLCVFVAAFFLPAIRSGAAGPDAVIFPGWKCASVALSMTTALFGKTVSGGPSTAVLLVAMSGWINPLIVLFLLFCVAARLRMARAIVAVVILLCMGATWSFFALQKVTPLTGHYLWIAGALVILLPEVIIWRNKHT
jgi:hypothetical protein